MSYIDLGARGPLKGALDNTGRNPGNWTVTFDPATINCNVNPFFEVYKMIVTGGAPTATFNIFRDATPWDVAVYAPLNSWDPANPLILRPGQFLYFFYSDLATDGFQPTVTLHLRYDPAVAREMLWLIADGK